MKDTDFNNELQAPVETITANLDAQTSNDASPETPTDDAVNKDQKETIFIKPGDDFSDVIIPDVSDSSENSKKEESENSSPDNGSCDAHTTSPLSENEFTIGIWLFTIIKGGIAKLKGFCRSCVIQKFTEYGYYKRYRDKMSYIFIREQDGIIEETETVIVKDLFHQEVVDMKESMVISHNGSNAEVLPQKLKETFLNQSNIIFNRQFLEHLPNHTKPILKDDKTTANFFFQNQIIMVTANGIDYVEYRDILDYCIWKNQQIEHVFTYNPDNKNCHFAKFVRNVTNNDPLRLGALVSGIGYQLHNYNHPSGGQAVLLYDEEIADISSPMGGTGKGLIGNAIAEMREVVKIDGKKFNPKDRFCFQDISDSTQVVLFDDAKPDLGFDRFHSILTDGWSVEKKHKDQFFIKPKDSPKMLITSNSILSSDGNTNKRRQHVIELSDHYSKQFKAGIKEPIKSEHGCTFFDEQDWDAVEWNKFYSYMLECIQYYLEFGLQDYPHVNVEENKLRQATSEEFCEWTKSQNFQKGVKYGISDLCREFTDIYYGSSSNDFNQRTFNQWMKKFAASREWTMEIKKSNSSNFCTFK